MTFTSMLGFTLLAPSGRPHLGDDVRKGLETVDGTDLPVLLSLAASVPIRYPIGFVVVDRGDVRPGAAGAGATTKWSWENRGTTRWAADRKRPV